MSDVLEKFSPVYANFLFLACVYKVDFRAFCVGIFTFVQAQRAEPADLRLAAQTKAKFPGITKSG